MILEARDFKSCEVHKLNKTARRQINILANDGNIVGITKLDDTKMIE